MGKHPSNADRSSAMPPFPPGTPSFQAARVAPTQASAHRVLALTALLWLNAGCATQGQLVDPFPGTAGLAAPSVDRGLPAADWSVPGADRSVPGTDRSAPGAAAEPAVRPVDQATLERLLAEAEDAYEGARWGQALEAFKAVTAFDPGNPQAWLRIGNLHHRRGHLLAAASAYRKAGSGAQGEARLKALVNLVSVNLELARAALDEARALAGDGADATTAARGALGAELARQADALERFSRARSWADRKGEEAVPPRSRALRTDRRIDRDRPGEVGRSTDRDAGGGEGGPGRVDAHRAFRGDAPAGPRRAAGAPERGQPSRSAPEQPTIEYVRGAPRS
ncbi:MAG: hypothetical protein AB7S63_15555 [Thauera sp.]